MFITKKQGLKFYILYSYRPIIMAMIILYLAFTITNTFHNSNGLLKYFVWVLWSIAIIIASLRMNFSKHSKNIKPLYIYSYYSNFFFNKIGFIYKENENFHINNIQGELSLDDLDKSFTETDKIISKESINNKAIYFFKLSPKYK